MSKGPDFWFDGVPNDRLALQVGELLVEMEVRLTERIRRLEGADQQPAERRAEALREVARGEAAEVIERVLPELGRLRFAHLDEAEHGARFPPVRLLRGNDEDEP